MDTFAMTKGLWKGRFSAILTTFFLLFLVVPVLPTRWASGVTDLLSMVVLISCLRAIVVSHRYRIFMALFIVSLVLVESFAALNGFGAGWFLILVRSLKLGYLLLVFITIMRYVLDRTPVTVDKVFGALSAYFLMGFAWSFGFTIFLLINPASFNVPPDADPVWSIYFSFTTLTTLGYGDITPQTTAARSYAVMEAATGQIFLAVIVARLIALQIAPNSKD
jgi:hypothetical protein